MSHDEAVPIKVRIADRGVNEKRRVLVIKGGAEPDLVSAGVGTLFLEAQRNLVNHPADVTFLMYRGSRCIRQANQVEMQHSLASNPAFQE
jgi:hypothetical protein